MTDAREQELLDRISELVAENASLRACIARLEQQLIELSAFPPPSVLKRLRGLRITPGALVQQMSDLAGWLKPEYEAIQSALRQSSSVHKESKQLRILISSIDN